MKTNTALKLEELRPVIFTKPAPTAKTKYTYIDKRGGFHFSQGMRQDYDVIDSNFVRLAYDAEHNAICLQFLKNKALGASKITKTKAGSWRINRKSFFTNFELPLDQLNNHFFVAKTLLPATGLWFIINLQNPIPTTK